MLYQTHHTPLLSAHTFIKMQTRGYSRVHVSAMTYSSLVILIKAFQAYFSTTGQLRDVSSKRWKDIQKLSDGGDLQKRVLHG